MTLHPRLDVRSMPRIRDPASFRETKDGLRSTLRGCLGEALFCLIFWTTGLADRSGPAEVCRWGVPCEHRRHRSAAFPLFAPRLAASRAWYRVCNLSCCDAESIHPAAPIESRNGHTLRRRSQPGAARRFVGVDRVIRVCRECSGGGGLDFDSNCGFFRRS